MPSPCLLKILHRKIFFGKNCQPLRGFPLGAGVARFVADCCKTV